jgi:hypothetical protein
MLDDGEKRGPIAAEAQTADSSSRRHLRVNAEGISASLVSDDEAPTPDLSLLNISVTGAAVLSPEPLGESNESVWIDIVPSAERGPLRTVCQIRYLIGEQHPSSDGPRWLHGMRFVRPSPEFLSLVDSYVRDQNQLELAAASR